MNKIITLTSTVKNKDKTNMEVRVFVELIGQYWRVDNSFTIVRFKDGGSFSYIETPEEIDKLIFDDCKHDEENKS